MNHLQKPTRTTLSAQIVEQMEQCIRDKIWPVGIRIPGEIELMESFGVSRNTVREATLSLVHAGLLQALPGDGTYVISCDRLDAALQRRLKDAKLREILEVRLTLEVNIARLASIYSTEEDLVALKKIQELCDNTDLSTDVFIEFDTEFHLQLARQSHNSLMYDLYKSCIAFIEDEIRVYQVKSENYRQRNEHRAIYDAVVSHDPDRAALSVQALLEMEQKAFQNAGLL